MTTFLDANVVIYYLTGDERRFASCRALIGRLERGEESAETNDLVFAEVVWVLSAQRPKPSRASIRDALSDIIRMPGLALPDESLLLSALELYASTPIDYIDAYNAVVMRKRGLDRIYSYGADFERVAGVTRVEP